MSISGRQDLAQAELCGGFSCEDARRVRVTINYRIPGGVVQYNDEESGRLNSN